MVEYKATARRRAVFRKQLILPAEHGSWPWLLVPFVVGVGVAQMANLAVWLMLVAGLALFLMRQPATVWLRARRGKARRADGPLAADWMLALAAVTLLCTWGLLALGRTALLWLAIPFTVLFLFYLAAARYGRSGLRSLWMELVGAAGLSMMAPAAIIAATGAATRFTWVLWIVMALQNTLGALYARLRIFDTHQRPIRRPSVFWFHLLGLVIIIVMSAFDLVPFLAAVPFAGFLARAGWVAVRPRPVENVKRLGFIELGVEIISGVWIIASYWLS